CVASSPRVPPAPGTPCRLPYPYRVEPPRGVPTSPVNTSPLAPCLIDKPPRSAPLHPRTERLPVPCPDRPARVRPDRPPSPPRVLASPALDGPTSLVRTGLTPSRQTDVPTLAHPAPLRPIRTDYPRLPVPRLLASRRQVYPGPGFSTPSCPDSPHLALPGQPSAPQSDATAHSSPGQRSPAPV